MHIHQLLDILDHWAPFCLQESYDNSGLIIGSRQSPITGLLISLDLTPEVISEALEIGANTIITHHPILFTGLKRVTEDTDIVQECLRLCIKNDINIIAYHTNLDNVHTGVNKKIAALLNIQDPRILLPKSQTLSKLSYYVPKEHHEELASKLFQAGAGSIGKYAGCSFSQEGTGTFTPLEGSSPFVGEVGQAHEEKELRVEMMIPSHLSSIVVSTLMQYHPYETVAYDLISVENKNPEIGAGMIGLLPSPIEVEDFMSQIKEVFGMPYLRHTKYTNSSVQKIAFCGGSGSFLIPTARAQKADLYLTADVKYHDFFSTDTSMLIVDMGHYEMEQFTGQLIFDYLSEKKLTFAVHLSKTNTNPINYF